MATCPIPFLRVLVEKSDRQENLNVDNPPAIIGVFDCDGTIVMDGTNESKPSSTDAIDEMMKLAPVVVMGTKRAGIVGQNDCGNAAGLYSNVMESLSDAPELRSYFIFGHDKKKEWDHKISLLERVYWKWKEIIPSLTREQIVLFDDENANVEAVRSAKFSAELVPRAIKDSLNPRSGMESGLTTALVKSVQWSDRYKAMIDWYEHLSDFNAPNVDENSQKRARVSTRSIAQALIKTSGNVEAAARLILSGTGL
jgi:hypothetical protein